MTDVIVVGSGPGGVNAAAALVEAGRSVLLIDYGNEDRRYAPLIPHRPFSELRRADRQQHRYFLGDEFEGIPFGPVRVGAQLTPPRVHIFADADERTPVDSGDFAASMSLARGGLGAGWSAGVFPFSDDELRDMGFTVDDLRPHYDAIAERIPVAGDRDSLLEGRVRVVEPSGFTKISSLGVEEQRVNVIVDLTSPAERWNRLGDGYRLDTTFIIWESADVLQVPAGALFRRGDGWALFTVEKGRAKMIPVEVGRRNGIAAEIV